MVSHERADVRTVLSMVLNDVAAAPTMPVYGCERSKGRPMNEITAAGGTAPSRKAICERARALVPALAEGAAEAEALRRLPDRTVADFEAAELCKLWIPRRFGGLETGLRTGLDVLFEIARGCASSAWCLSVWAQHNWIVGHFPEAAQAETLGVEPNFHIAAVLAPRGTIGPADGGYILNGVWPFASGCDHGTWIMLGGQRVDADSRPVALDREIFGNPVVDARLCLVPIEAVTNRGDWHVAGLCGTGSHTIEARDLFVPEHRTLFIADAVEGRTPGRAVNDGPLFAATFYSFLPIALCGPAPGVAQGMLDHLTGIVGKRIVPPMNRPQIDLVRTHRQIAEADAKIQIARLLLGDAADRIMNAAAAGRQLTAAERALCRRNGVLATQHAYEAGEIVFFAAGGSQLSLESPLQRAMRDLHAIKAHFFMDVDTAYELSGMTRLGLDPYTYVF